MQQNGTNPQHYPTDQLTVVYATAVISPRPRLVRVCLDITPDEAYALADRCTAPHQAGFAGAVNQAAFWARWGAPINTNHFGLAGFVPNRPDPGE